MRERVPGGDQKADACRLIIVRFRKFVLDWEQWLFSTCEKSLFLEIFYAKTPTTNSTNTESLLILLRYVWDLGVITCLLLCYTHIITTLGHFQYYNILDDSEVWFHLPSCTDPTKLNLSSRVYHTAQKTLGVQTKCSISAFKNTPS